MKAACLNTKTRAFAASGVAESLFSLAVARGADKHKLLHGTGIFLDDFDSEHKLSAKQILRLCENAQQEIKTADLGFQLGHAMLNKLDNDVLTMLKSAKNFKLCLRLLGVLNAQYFGLVSAHQFSDNTYQYLVLQDAIGLEKNATLMLEAALAGLVALSKLCLGRRLKCTFLFPYKKPKHIYDYEANLGYRLHFSEALLIIKVPHQESVLPFKEANLPLQRYIFKNLFNQRAHQATVIDKIRSQLRAKPHLSLPMVAQYLNLSTATLKRTLKEHGTNFQKIEDELRCQQALYYLHIQKLKNEQSAHKMQFADVNNFRRMVKRLTGRTPSELRGV